MAVTISDFSGEHEFLSMWYVGWPITFNEYVAATGEHLFSAMKARRGEDFRKILACETPGAAKAEGRHLLALRPDWSRVKLDVMRYVLGVKFTLERDEGVKLVGTETQLLVADYAVCGPVWGAQWLDPVWAGRNWLGVLLMARRAELLAEGLSGGADQVDYGATLEHIRYRPATADR